MLTMPRGNDTAVMSATLFALSLCAASVGRSVGNCDIACREFVNNHPSQQRDHLFFRIFVHFSFFITCTMSTAVAAAAGIKRKETSTTSTNMTTKKKTKGGYDVPWVEKYRPRNLDDVVGNEDTLVRLRAIAEDGNMPNLILCGPPGTGKVSDGSSHCIYVAEITGYI